MIWRREAAGTTNLVCCFIPNSSVNIHNFIRTLFGLLTAKGSHTVQERKRANKMWTQIWTLFDSEVVMYMTVRTHLLLTRFLSRVHCTEFLKNKGATRRPFNVNTHWQEKNNNIMPLSCSFFFFFSAMSKQLATGSQVTKPIKSLWRNNNRKKKKKQVWTRCTRRFCTTKDRGKKERPRK